MPKFTRLDADPVFKIDFRRRAKRFAQDAARRTEHPGIRQEVRRAYEASATSLQAVARAYDIEYGGSEPNYAYLSPLLSPRGFEIITGGFSGPAPVRILDVGAGSNEFLRFCRDELELPASHLAGVDISPASVARICADGFAGYCGRLENVPLPGASFDIVYLSFFIDYDTDQRATFDAALRLTKPGGSIVIEGLFPVRPFALLDSDLSTFSFITKGRSAKNDIALVSQAIEVNARAYDRAAHLDHVYTGVRYVHSRFGFSKLRTHFLVFSVA